MASKEDKGPNIFVDMSGSTGRKPERCADATTCITPSHPIYSIQLRRYLQPKELLGLQCMWEVDSAKPEVFTKMAHSSLAQDLAGNGMTGSVVQAVVLAALSSSDAFLHLGNSTAEPDLGEMMVQSQQDDDEHELHSGDQTPADEGDDPNQEHQPPSRQKRKRSPKKQSSPKMVLAVPLRRVRGKQPGLPGLLAVPPPKRKRGYGGGNKNAKGKSQMVSIYDKEKICKAYDELVASGEHCPDKELKKWKMKGWYRGCCLQSKWGRARVEQQWPLLVETAPRLCKAKKELPNSLRQVINFPRLKHGNHSTSASRTFLPPALKHVLEEMIMEKIDRGEEVNISYVKNTIVWLVQLWNDCIISVRERITQQNLDQLAKDDDRLATLNEKELDEVFTNMTKRADEVLVPIALSSADDSVRSTVGAGSVMF